MLQQERCVRRSAAAASSAPSASPSRANGQRLADGFAKTSQQQQQQQRSRGVNCTRYSSVCTALLGRATQQSTGAPERLVAALGRGGRCLSITLAPALLSVCAAPSPIAQTCTWEPHPRQESTATTSDRRQTRDRPAPGPFSAPTPRPRAARPLSSRLTKYPPVFRCLLPPSRDVGMKNRVPLANLLLVRLVLEA